MLAFRKNLKRYHMNPPAAIWTEIQSEVRKAVAERVSLLQEHIDHLKELGLWEDDTYDGSEYISKT
mgnify:CR=1 FL=1